MLLRSALQDRLLRCGALRYGSSSSLAGATCEEDTLTSTTHREAVLQHHQQCLQKYRSFIYNPGMVYCNAMYDGYLCWPPTPAAAVAEQHCPPARLSDTSRLAYRRCGELGLWLGRRINESSQLGWTNYTLCFPLEVQALFVKVSNDDTDARIKLETAQKTRYMEIVGFSISLAALLISLVIFSYYRSLRNNRTKIHKSLFSAMVMQVLIRLVVYIDQALIRNTVDDLSVYDNVTVRGIDNMPYICETSYILLEYAVTAMFMWMFIEGFYLHKFVTASALRDTHCHTLYYITGWGLPVVVTAVWAAVTGMQYGKEPVRTCWYGYNFLKFYWIVQGPRLAVIVINLVFLLNIMRVLIIKLRRSKNSEMEKVRKAVKAALVLLPLLGITNALNMIEGPLEGNVWEFGIWSYTTHFLRSFQGFFIALIYCFLNGEVRQVLKKHYNNYMAMRMYTQQPRRNNPVMNNTSSSDECRAPKKNSSKNSSRFVPLQLISKTSQPKQLTSETRAANAGQGESSRQPLEPVKEKNSVVQVAL